MHEHAHACTREQAAQTHAHTPPAWCCQFHISQHSSPRAGPTEAAGESEADQWFREDTVRGDWDQQAAWGGGSWLGMGPACPGEPGYRWAQSLSQALTRVLLTLPLSRKSPLPTLGPGRVCWPGMEAGKGRDPSDPTLVRKQQQQQPPQRHWVTFGVNHSGWHH